MIDNSRNLSKQNQFSLVRLKTDCRILPIYVDFSPPFISSAANGSILPVFNDDRCHFTQAFLLSSQKKTQHQRKQAQRMKFEHRIRHSIQSLASEATLQMGEKMTEKTPPPNYCQICQQYFKNYEQHVQRKNHILRLHHNEFNQDIRQLCSLVDLSENVTSPCSKRKMIKKKDYEANSIKSRPLTVDIQSKRKMSFSEQEASFSGTSQKQYLQI